MRVTISENEKNLVWDYLRSNNVIFFESTHLDKVHFLAKLRNTLRAQELIE